MKKLVVHFVLYQSCISPEEKAKKLLFMGCKFSFPYVDTYSDVPKSKFVLENSNLNVGCVPAYFCGGQKNNLLL